MIKILNGGTAAKEIRCVDATGVERRILEIRKGDIEWWRGKLDPPSIGGTWEEISDGIYRAKATIASYTDFHFGNTSTDPTNYVISTFNAYENTLAIEFFGDFENVPFEHSISDVSGNVLIPFSYTANGYTQKYWFSCNVFPDADGSVTRQSFVIDSIDPGFTEDATFVSNYGQYYVVQGEAGHTAMLNSAYGYADDITNWGKYGRSDSTWYNHYTGVSDDYINAIDGRAFHVATSGSTAVVTFCPPGGIEAGWVASTDTWFPEASGWLQLTKKDGYTKFFNVNSGRFVEFLDKSKVSSTVLSMARSSLGTKMTDEYYENSVICTLMTEKYFSGIIQTAPSDLSGEMDDDSDYYGEYYFELYTIPFVDIDNRTYMWGQYNPSVPFVNIVDNGDGTMGYTVDNHLLYYAQMTFNYSTGDISAKLVANPDSGLANNTYLTGTYPAANYKYFIDQSNEYYVALVIACVKDYNDDIVGYFHEYRLPTGFTWSLTSTSVKLNGASTATSLTPANGYVRGTCSYGSSVGSFYMVLRPSVLRNSYYHYVVSTHKNVSTSANAKNIEVWANRKYFYKEAYETPQDSIEYGKKVYPLYWHVADNTLDGLKQNLEVTRYLVSTETVSRGTETITLDWDPDHTVMQATDRPRRYTVDITASTIRLTIGTLRFDWIEYDLPIIGSALADDAESGYYFEPADGVDTNVLKHVSESEVLTITHDRVNGVITCTSTAKNNIPGYTTNPEQFSFYWMFPESNPYHFRYLGVYAYGGGRYLLDMVTGEYEEL